MTISTGVVIFIIFASAVILGFLIWLFILFSKREEDKNDDTIIWNLINNHAIPVKGYLEGLQVKDDLVDGRHIIEYIPRDVDVKDIKNNIEIPHITVVVDKNKVIDLPKGTLSGRRNVRILLANNSEDYSPAFKRSILGPLYMALTEKISGDNVESKIIREGSTRKTDLLTELGDGEISQEVIEQYKEREKDLAKVDTKTNTNSLNLNSPKS